MDTQILHKAIAELRGLLEAPTLVARASNEEPSALALILEREDSSEPRRLVIEVDTACATLHLDRRISAPPTSTPTSRLGGALLTGARLVAVEATEHPRVFRLLCDPMEGQPFALMMEWTGRNHGNLRLVDPAGRVLWTRRKGGSKPGEVYRLPKNPAPTGAVSGQTGGETPSVHEALSLELIDAPAVQWPARLARFHHPASVASAYARLALLENAGTDSSAETVARRLLEVWEEEGTSLDTSVTPESFPPARLYRFSAQERLPVPFAVPEETATAEELGLPPAAVLLLHPPHLEPLAGSEETDRVLSLLGVAHAPLVKRRADQALRDLYTATLDKEMKRLMKTRAKIEKERGGLDASTLRKHGQAILSNLAQIEKGARELHCQDWEAEPEAAPLVIKLDPAKPATDVAESYFQKARRWEKGEPIRRRRIELVDRAIAELSMIQVKVTDLATMPLPEKIEDWLKNGLETFYRPLDSRPEGATIWAWSRARGDAVSKEASTAPSKRGASPSRGGVKGKKGPGPRRGGRPKWSPRTFQTRDGWSVVVGRSNEENDYVSHKLARPNDLWFHAHGVPGSHVLLRRDGRKDNPSSKTIEEAAAIAAFYSKARNARKAPVIYTLAKYVRKPRKAKAGLAVCSQEKMVMVAPKNPEEGKAPEWMES